MIRYIILLILIALFGCSKETLVQQNGYEYTATLTITGITYYSGYLGNGHMVKTKTITGSFHAGKYINETIQPDNGGYVKYHFESGQFGFVKDYEGYGNVVLEYQY